MVRRRMRGREAEEVPGLGNAEDPWVARHGVRPWAILADL